MSQNIAKTMAYIMNESGGDFQQGTSQPVAVNEHPNTRRRLTGLRKSRPVNLWQWRCDNY